jgi:fibronectin type 3 domain-containing protein
MRRLPSLRLTRPVLLLFFAFLTPLGGCGKIRSWYESRTAPANLHSVSISWTASPSSVEGYNVYRAAEGGTPTRITVRLVPGTRYTDATVDAGHTYTYYVTSVDFKGTESIPSEKITVAVPGSAAPGAAN